MVSSFSFFFLLFLLRRLPITQTGTGEIDRSGPLPSGVHAGAKAFGTERKRNARFAERDAHRAERNGFAEGPAHAIHP